MRLCLICGEPAEIICDIDEFYMSESYWWKHNCDNNVKIESSSIYASEENAIKNWNNFCKTIEEFGREWLNKGRAIGHRYGYDYGYKVGYEKGWKEND